MHPASRCWHQAHVYCSGTDNRADREHDEWHAGEFALKTWADGSTVSPTRSERTSMMPVKRAELVMPPVAVKVVVQATSDWVIPETG